jgi:SAM-dependent methyltransferase
MNDRYIGAELDTFAAAANWKSYMARSIGRYIGGRVLEVGAGIGINTRFLYNPRVCEWVCLEPDPDLAGRIGKRLIHGELPRGCRVVNGTVGSLEANARFDTILYLDVLEHIAEDGAELARAAALLWPRGRLVVLAPAHQFLFSPFDTAIGHYRRYSRARLRTLTPARCRFEVGMMLDSAGFFASAANRFLFSSPMPSYRQIAVWDRFLVPISRVLDRMTAHRFGKSVVAVWQCDPEAVGLPLRRARRS